jgi:MoaA/NifB/PqqE/SkfB family radical SAM enzyme
MSVDVHNKLRETYDIVYINYLSTFFESPINLLYTELTKAKQTEYGSNQRIVIIDNVLGCENEKQSFFVYLYKILNHLDITNFFVLVVSNSISVKQTITDTKHCSSDSTVLQFELMPVEQIVPKSITNFQIPDTICVNPWINLAIFEDGRVSTCCLLEDGSEYTIIKNSLVNIATSQNHKILRQQFLQGERPDNCSQCWQNENAGKLSKRLNDNYVFKDKLFDIDWNNVDKSDLVALDIKLKNTCNLSCRICSPRFSSKWYDEMKNHQEIYPEFVNFKNIKLEWRDDITDRLWTDIAQIGKNIRYINFSGGEPLLDKTHVTVLQYLIDIGVSGETSLHYNTNGTVYAEKLIPIWNKFKSVELSFSIDNIGDKFQYERYGANWKQTVDVLNQYLKLDKNTYSFNLNNTVSILNILDIYELYLFAVNKNLNLSFNMLTSPTELSILNMTSKHKTHITNKLNSINDQQFQKQITSVLTYLNAPVAIEGNINDTLNYLQKTDRVRKQQFESVYTELASMLTHQ